LSFDGDSGPYLQYAYIRTKSILEKAEAFNLKIQKKNLKPELITDAESKLMRLLYKFPLLVIRAGEEYAPQIITTFLIELAGEFNSYYAGNKIIDEKNKEISEFRVALAQAVNSVLKNGLYVLGIGVPSKM
jgi:arginyl-tRNA synthetase